MWYRWSFSSVSSRARSLVRETLFRSLINLNIFRFNLEEFTTGLSFIVIGLFKKAVIADTLSHFVDPVFSRLQDTSGPSLFYAWFGALGFMLQLYFDFSGYSDMAYGGSREFSILKSHLILNSPYKASNIIDFWKRWHMTLTHFLTSYIYNPIALRVIRRRLSTGKPIVQRGRTTPAAYASIIFFPTVFTMLLAGIWHGTGLTSVVFGGLHGIYLAILSRLASSPGSIGKSTRRILRGGGYGRRMLSRWFVSVCHRVFSRCSIERHDDAKGHGRSLWPVC